MSLAEKIRRARALKAWMDALVLSDEPLPPLYGDELVYVANGRLARLLASLNVAPLMMPFEPEEPPLPEPPEAPERPRERAQLVRPSAMAEYKDER